MEQSLSVYDYILQEEAAYKTVRVPITQSKDWNMHEHIERCTNVANAWFHSGQNDGLRPYKDIVTPILNLAFRSEGFDVKDIVPFVNDSKNYYKSFLIKKYQPSYARNNKMDAFIDEIVETSIVYDLVLTMKLQGSAPSVVKLQSIAFCDQTDILSGPICLKYQMTVSEILGQKGKWDETAIDEAIVVAPSQKAVPNANNKPAKTPGKYIEVYQLRGMLPDWWLDAENYDASYGSYSDQTHIVCYYTGTDGKRHGITFFKGKSKSIAETFKALKIDQVKSYGRAAGRSVVEQLFEPQVWTNYSEIKIKDMLDAAAVNLLQTSSDDFGNQRLDTLKNNFVLKHEDGKPITALDTTPRNLPAFTNHQAGLENNARVIGSASDVQVADKITAGSPFALQNLIAQQGDGIHEYRKGKIASFFSDELYKDWILPDLVAEMNEGKEFSEDLSFDEVQEIAETIATNIGEKKAAEMMLDGKVVTQEAKDQIISFEKNRLMKMNKRGFFKAIKGELDNIPTDVFVNIKGKQKDMAKAADSLTNIIRFVIASPGAFAQIPGLGKVVNELLENSGLSKIDFTQIVTPRQISSPAAKPAEMVGAGV